MHPEQPMPPQPSGDGAPHSAPLPPPAFPGGAPQPPAYPQPAVPAPYPPPPGPYPQVPQAASTVPVQDGLYQVPNPGPGQPPLLPLGDPIMRLMARLIDGFMAFLCIMAVGLLITMVVLIANGGDMDSAPSWQMAPLVVLIVSTGFLYEWLLVRAFGQSIGKRLLGLRIVNASDGGRVSSGKAALRALCYAPSVYHPTNWLVGLAQVNVLWMLWDRPGRQCLHDKIVKTVVIDERRLRDLYPPQPPVFQYGAYPQYPQPPHGG